MTPAKADSTRVTVEIRDLWQMTGKQSHAPERRTLSEWTGVPASSSSKYLVLFEWDCRLTYLTVAATAGSADESDLVKFTSDPERARKLFRDYGWPPDRFPESVKATELDNPVNRFLVAEVEPILGENETYLTIQFTVDTNDRAFRQYGDTLAQGKAPRAPAEVPVPMLTCTSYFKQVLVPKGHRQTQIHLSPAREMDPYKGYVALDLGNTNSALAFMSHDDPDPNNVKVVGDGERNGVTPTAVRVRSIDPIVSPPPQQPGKPAPGGKLPAADFAIGRDARVGTTGTLVLGAKRLLAAPQTVADPGYTVWVGGQSRAIPRQLPAELFVSGMLHRFHASEHKKVQRLAVTCPTSFNDREIEQLKEVVFRAVGRALGADSTPPPEIAEKFKQNMIPLVIDEASAAAFFFLYRDFIRAHAGTRGVRYQYPKGVNLLLYDCGGGTTDLALVQVRPATEGDAKSDRAYSHLFIDVLGRTGMRGFGGDNITQAAFRLLKAKLATHGPQRHVSVPSFPDDVRELQAYLDNRSNQEFFDQIIPTQFQDPDNPSRRKAYLSPEDIKTRMERHLDLWVWAEQFKIALSDAGHDEISVPPVQGSSLLRLLAQAWNTGENEAFSRLESVVIKRSELDELIRAQVKESVDKANHLIESRLKEGEVHRVYVVGNASRYPLIQEMLRDHLRVRFLTDEKGVEKRLIMDDSNLKHAVAKGAVIALRLRVRAEGVYVGYDDELIQRLPYTIGYPDLTRGDDYQSVYREHEKYPELKPTAIAVPRAEPASRRVGPEFALYRQWPGEREWEYFVDFVFERPVDGPLQLRHEKNPPRFVIKDEGKSKQEVTGSEKPLADFVSPAQQGRY